VRSEVPPEVFTTEYKNPVNASPQNLRKNLVKATQLLKDAGWEVKDGVLTNVKTRKTFQVEFLLVNDTFVRVIEPYLQALNKLGIQGKIRVVDPSQYQYRVINFDFDIIISGFSQSESPGNEQRFYWSSAAADHKGTRNYIGIKDPAVDKLIERVIFAKDRAELVAATRALDRVLLWNYYCVPQWHVPNERFAYWNRFSHAEPLPNRDAGIGFPSVWWYDKTKAAKLGSR
jgi:microcin C transport system substrate-binding protein